MLSPSTSVVAVELGKSISVGSPFHTVKSRYRHRTVWYLINPGVNNMTDGNPVMVISKGFSYVTDKGYTVTF